MMPNGWKEVKFGDLFSLTSGKTKPKNLTELKDDMNSNPVYGGNGIIGYSPEVLTNNPNIIIGRVGEYCGTVRHVNSPCWITDNALYIRELKEQVNVGFLAYKLQYFDLTKLRKKGGQPLVSQEPIYNAKSSIPTNVAEQEKIAKILSTWDEAIEKLDRLITKKTTARNLIVEDIFTKKMSLGFKSWADVKIGDLCEINAQNISNQDKDFYYIDLSSVSSGLILYPKETINRDHAPSRAKRKCQKNDILISNVRPNLKGFAVIDQDIGNLVASTGFSVLRTKSHYIHVVYSAFYSTSITNQINSVVTGSSYPAMNSSDVANFSIRVPKDESEARKLGQILECSESEIKVLKIIKTKLQLQKSGLMQQLLTGRKRVKV